MAKEYARQFYSSKAWQDCRNEYMKCAGYLCEDCMKRGVYRPGIEVHHVEELKPWNIHRPEVTLNFDNLVLLCRDVTRRDTKVIRTDGTLLVITGR